MKLLFKKNKLIYYKYGIRNCPCYKNEIEKCYYPGNPTIIKANKNFKDEPEEIIETFHCTFKKYYGPVGIALNELTRKQYEGMLEKNTWCAYPQEDEIKIEYRCYKCNLVVKSETERHKCNI